MNTNFFEKSDNKINNYNNSNIIKVKSIKTIFVDNKKQYSPIKVVKKSLEKNNNNKNNNNNTINHINNHTIYFSSNKKSLNHFEPKIKIKINEFNMNNSNKDIIERKNKHTDVFVSKRSMTSEGNKENNTVKPKAKNNFISASVDSKKIKVNTKFINMSDGKKEIENRNYRDNNNNTYTYNNHYNYNISNIRGKSVEENKCRIKIPCQKRYFSLERKRENSVNSNKTIIYKNNKNNTNTNFYSSSSDNLSIKLVSGLSKEKLNSLSNHFLRSSLVGSNDKLIF